MNASTRRLLIGFVVLTISVAIVIFGSAAPAQKLSSVAPPQKPHDSAALFFKFDQLDHFYRVPGEFTHRLTGDQYGFEALSFIITETHPGRSAAHVQERREQALQLDRGVRVEAPQQQEDWAEPADSRAAEPRRATTWLYTLVNRPLVLA